MKAVGTIQATYREYAMFYLKYNKQLSYGRERARSFRLTSGFIRKITKLHLEPPYGEFRGNKRFI